MKYCIHVINLGNSVNGALGKLLGAKNLSQKVAIHNAVLVPTLTYGSENCKKYRYDYVYYPEIKGWLKQNIIPTTWREARLRCQLEGGELASPIDDGFLKTLKSRSHVSTWTGVHSLFSKGDYFSIGGLPILRMPISWAPGEPDNHEDKEQCIVMMPNGTFADVCCDEMFPYFCFKKKSSSHVINVCGTVDPGYTYEPRTGSCYKFHDHVETWTRAYMTCAAEGAYLVIMDTAIEIQVLVEIFSKYPTSKIYGLTPFKNDIFVGVHDWGEPGLWTTIHGQPIDRLLTTGVINWAGGQPDNATLSGLGQSCTTITRLGHFNDGWCHARAPFICEKAPDSLDDDE
ncbi:hypothetical protein K1T71_006915 [Dendrolimus kikuchii]|uniref:Uncharacterized protein n=1 Tax=Dendrolimus kikuchii TaxID=765133 RepID=A0ACC1CZ78_9NEOP|nr:hypothetical protein K1T71_006915 [Dendrolimus kikuchii]